MIGGLRAKQRAVKILAITGDVKAFPIACLRLFSSSRESVEVGDLLQPTGKPRRRSPSETEMTLWLGVLLSDEPALALWAMLYDS